MKIGLFFGSFNPIHIGHLIIANYMAEHTELDKVWLVVSPHNPLKDKAYLINAYDRLEMCKLAIDDYDKINVSDIELHLPSPSYTIDTLTYLKEKHPNTEFCLIMGADNLSNIKKWKNYEILLRDYHIYVYPRNKENTSEFTSLKNVHITDTPIMEISSTFIRKSIKENKSVKFLVPDMVIDFIESKSLYRS